jgi:hypothetical protein
VDGTRQSSRAEKTGKFRFTQPKASTSERGETFYAPAKVQNLIEYSRLPSIREDSTFQVQVNATRKDNPLQIAPFPN